LEPVLDQEGVLWIDDSKATNDDAARRALGAFGERRIIWIGGGRSKGVGPDNLVEEVTRRAAHAMLIGETAMELDRSLAAHGFANRHLAGTLAEAVGEARRLARPGDVVLLAPGYASFDQFSDFEARGRAFVALLEDGGADPLRAEASRAASSAAGALSAGSPRAQAPGAEVSSGDGEV
ncbi:MAG: glutamate ligase domain-containing protein, partial [Candidatus Dormibacteria bacterium]